MPIIYILSDYDEHGAENLIATLDRDKVMAMVDANWPNFVPDAKPHGDGYVQHQTFVRYRKWIADAKAGLAKLLEKPDSELLQRQSGWNCTDDWGGMQLHVTEVYDS